MKILTAADENFLMEILATVEKYIADKQFDDEALAREAGIGRSTLNNRLQALLGQSGRQFIMTVRLQQAAEFLREESVSVSSAACRAGFSSAAYFARCFKKRFGCSPSEFS